jgi:antitoxin component YwqK of YwqJK toxin-antitoxin module
MEKRYIVVILLCQLILGAMVLAALGVGRGSSGDMPGKNAVGMAASYNPGDVEEKDALPQLNKTIPSEKKRNASNTSAISSTHVTPTTITEYIHRPLKEEEVFVCPLGIPAGAKRVNTSYANGFRQFYVLPTGAYVGPYVEWYDPYKEQKRTLTCFGLYGKEDGPGMEWSPEGILVTEKNYDTGLLNGIYRTYYPSGALKEEYTYLKGKRSSIGKTFYEDGALKSNASYIDGKKYGAENEYYQGGSLMQEKYYDGDEWTGVSVSYDQSGDKYLEWQGKEEAGKFSGLYAEWDRGVACIYKEGMIMDCRYLKKESYKTGEIILENLNVMPGSDKMNGVPQFFNEE